MESEGLMAHAAQVGAEFLSGLADLQARFPSLVAEARGVGLMLALELTVPEARRIQRELLERGIIVNAVGETILRFLPPLVIGAEACRNVVGAIADLLASTRAD
jgi:acetylornithine/succinyldiaminopimelate/putrescine aminotransferase